MKYKRLNELREETQGQTRMLYHLDYWDGPLSGIMLWIGKKVYFKKTDEYTIKTLLSEDEIQDFREYCKLNNCSFDEDYDIYEHEYNWIYTAYEIDDETLEAIEFNHALFSKYVGTHTDYDEIGYRGCGARIPLRPEHPEDLGDLKPQSEWDKFYKSTEIKKETLNLKEENILGYFER